MSEHQPADPATAMTRRPAAAPALHCRQSQYRNSSARWLGLALLALALLFPLSAAAASLAGKIVNVAAGDLVILKDMSGRKHKIRLYGVACPAKDQPYAGEARKHTASLVSGKRILVRVYGRDRYGNKTGLVFADDISVNESLIKKGLAWRLAESCNESFCKAWLGFEDKAKARKAGLWKQKDPIPPWKE